MSLSKEDVASIADYARIALSDDELEQMLGYLNGAVELLEPIRHFDLGGVEPTFHPIGDLSNVMREDRAGADGRGLSLGEALKNAGSARERYFRVPSILGEGGDR